MNIDTLIRITLRSGDVINTTMDAGRFELERDYIRGMYRQGHRIQAIKHARRVFICGLRAAKYFAEEVSEPSCTVYKKVPVGGVVEMPDGSVTWEKTK